MPSQKPRLTVRASQALVEKWKKAADEAGSNLNDWIVFHLNEASEVTSPAAPVPRQKREYKVPSPKANPIPITNCEMSWAHRRGVFCKTCGRTP